MNINTSLGIILLVIAVSTIVMSFLIAFKQYVRVKAKNAAPISDDIITLFLQLLDDVLKAPPALSFLVVGMLIGAAGIWFLVTKPI